MPKPKPTKAGTAPVETPTTQEITVDEAYFNEHHELAEQGVNIGDTIEVTVEPTKKVEVEEKPSTKGKKSGISSVVFTLMHPDVRRREFSRDVHGENFLEVAAQFEETNKKLIRSREEA